MPPAALRFVLVLVVTLLGASSALAQSAEERARFAYEEAKRALERKSYAECIDYLQRARQHLGRPALRIQAPLVRCYYDSGRWADAVREAKVYFSLEGADPSLQEYQEVGSMLVRAEKRLEAEQKSALEAERRRQEEEQRRQEARKKWEEEQRQRRLALEEQRRRETQRRQEEEERRRQREADERAAYLAGAPARKAQYEARANAAQAEGMGHYVAGAGLFTGGLAAVGVGIGGIYMASVGTEDDNDLLVRLSGIGLIGLGVGAAYLCILEWGPDAMDAGNARFHEADNLRARARQEEALYLGGAR